MSFTYNILEPVSVVGTLIISILEMRYNVRMYVRKHLF